MNEVRKHLVFEGEQNWQGGKSLDGSPNNFGDRKTTGSAVAGMTSSIAAVRLFFAIRVVQAVVFFDIHGTGHFISEHCTVAVLEWPHALKIKKAHAVPVTKDVTQVGLETGHGAQLAIDEGDPPFLGTHPKSRQQIGHRAPFGKVHFHVGETPFPCLTSVACQSAIQPHIHSDMKLAAHKGGASRQGIIVHIVLLTPTYPAQAGRSTFRPGISSSCDKRENTNIIPRL